MGASYTWEKFFAALRGALTSTKSLQDRLADAYMEVSLAEADGLHGLGADERAAYREIATALATVTDDPLGVGTITLSARRLTDAEARELLLSLLSLYGHTVKHSLIYNDQEDKDD